MQEKVSLSSSGELESASRKRKKYFDISEVTKAEKQEVASSDLSDDIDVSQYMADLGGLFTEEEVSIGLQDISPEPSETLLEKVLQDDDPVHFNDSGHIESVRFLSQTMANRVIINRGYVPDHCPIADWTDIPSLVVLTGVNGSGKSIILRYLSNIIECNKNGAIESDNKSLYLGADDIPFSQDYYSSSAHYYHLLDREKFDHLIDKCESYIDHEENGESSLMANQKGNSALVQQICLEYKQDRKKENLLPKRELLKRIAMSIVPTSTVDMTDPFRYLTEAVSMHDERIRAMRVYLNQASNVRKLYEYYSNQQDNSISFDQFLILLEQNKEFELQLFDDAAKYFSGKSALDEVNEVLEKHNFKYRLISYPNRNDSRKSILKLKTTDSGNEPSLEYDITALDLSSGERMILTVMSWLYFKMDIEQRLQRGQKEEKIKILLLDEPDRHLDPKLCKLFFQIIQDEFVKIYNIQVIMSTHRFDSIVYAENGTVFVVKKENDLRKIMPSSRMEAIFKMTANIRELTSYERRVYTESICDAQFYQGVYLTLVNWFVKNSKGKWYPSRRHQLSFHAVSRPDAKRLNDNGKGDGGCKKVIIRIQEDKHNATSSDSNVSRGMLSRRYNLFRLINEPNLLKSFGILDQDYGDITKKLVEDGDVTDNVVIIKRYSLENFCLDPIIFCSVLIDVAYYAQHISLIKNKIYAHVLTKFVNISIEIKKLLALDLGDPCILNDLQKIVTHYFLILLPIVACSVLYSNDNKPESHEMCLLIFKMCGMITSEQTWPDLDKKEIDNRFKELFGKQEKFEHYLNTYPLMEDKLREKEIVITTKKDDKLLDFALHYPEMFFVMRGHTMESIFHHRYPPTDAIVQKIYDCGIDFIPQDLKESFVELKEKIKVNVRQATKPHFSYQNIASHNRINDSKEEEMSSLSENISAFDIKSSSSPKLMSSSKFNFFEQSKRQQSISNNPNERHKRRKLDVSENSLEVSK